MADHHDATLIVQLAQWGTSMGLQDAMSVVFADDFDREGIDERDPSVLTLLNFGETVGTLTKNGLLDTALVLDWIWVAGLWERLKPAVERARQKFGVDGLYENLEALAAQQS